MERPGRATRRRMLVRATGLVLSGGLAIAGGYAWTHGPGGTLFYDASRTSAELTSLFIDYAESHGWTKDPGPSTPESWIGRHGGTEPTDGMILNVAPDIGPHETDPLSGSVVVGLGYA